MSPAETYEIFMARPESAQIASRFACEGLARWLRWRTPNNVLEWGAGIGTLTQVICDYASRAAVFSVEPKPDLLDLCRANVRPSGMAPFFCCGVGRHGTAYEFVVVDGDDTPYEPLARRAVVFVEGGRRGQRTDRVMYWQIQGRSFCCAQWKPRDRSKGYHVYLFEPTAPERAWFAAVRVREWAMDLPVRLGGGTVGKRRERRYY